MRWLHLVFQNKTDMQGKHTEHVCYEWATSQAEPGPEKFTEARQQLSK